MEEQEKVHKGTRALLGDNRASRQNHRTGKEKGNKSIFNIKLTNSLLR